VLSRRNVAGYKCAPVLLHVCKNKRATLIHDIVACVRKHTTCSNVVIHGNVASLTFDMAVWLCNAAKGEH
jgi:hypothetical protein